MERSTLGSLLRTNQALCGQLCEKQTFDFGIAYYCDRFPQFPEVNQLREIIVHERPALESALAQAASFFSSRKVAAFRCSPAIGIDPEPLAAIARDRGWVRRDIVAMHMNHWISPEIHPAVRILPARAVRDVFQKTFTSHADHSGRDENAIAASAASDRLDDPQLDMFVATVDRLPAGRCGLYQVGDIARVVDLHVNPYFSKQNVAEALLSHVLTLAKRLAMPMVVAQRLDTDRKRLQLMSEFGFVDDGQSVEFEPPSPFTSLAPL